MFGLQGFSFSDEFYQKKQLDFNENDKENCRDNCSCKARKLTEKDSPRLRRVLQTSLSDSNNQSSFPLTISKKLVISPKSPLLKKQLPYFDEVPSTPIKVMDCVTPEVREDETSDTETETTMSCSSLEDRQMQTFLEDEFFEQQQPTEWFPIGVDEEGKISFSIPVAIGKICRLIYIFRDIETQEIALIGKTGTSFSSRMSRYKTQFNHPEKLKNKKSRFILAVRENPNRYEFGILYSLHEHESLDEYEKRFVEIRQPIFNQRKGGGGGLVHSSEKKVSYVLPNNPKLLTPEKRFRFQRIGGTIRPEIDLDSHQKMLAVAGKVKGVLYSIREVGTEKRYIGYTTLTDPYTRIRQHCYGSETFFSLSEKFDPTASDGALHPAIGQSPEGFSFGFLPILHDVSELNLEELKEYTVVSNIGEAEKTAIKILQTLVKQGGFNCNGGGGGPISRNLTQEFEEEALKSLN